MTAVIHTGHHQHQRTEREYRQYRRGTLAPMTAVHSQPNYAARRAVAVLLGALLLAVAAVAVSVVADAAVGVGGRPAAASDIVDASSGVPIVRMHVAQPGDTLWTIADRYRGEVGHNRFVDALIDVNGGTAIQVGQAVRLP